MKHYTPRKVRPKQAVIIRHPNKPDTHGVEVITVPAGGVKTLVRVRFLDPEELAEYDKQLTSRRRRG